MSLRALLLALPVLALASPVPGSSNSHPSPDVKSYFATFETLPADTVPVLAMNAPPKPYQGLDYDNVVVVANDETAVTNLETTQGKQFIATNTDDTPVISVPDTQTFSLQSAYVGIFVASDNAAVIPAQNGTVVFTGTRPDGSTVVESYDYYPAGPGVVVVDGIAVLGHALAQEVCFTKLTGITTLVVSVGLDSSAIDVGGPAVCDTLNTLGLTLDMTFNGLLLDGLKYDVFEWNGPPPSNGQSW